jgi:hypothetical protein
MHIMFPDEDSMQTVAIFALQTKESIAHFVLLRAGNFPSWLRELQGVASLHPYKNRRRAEEKKNGGGGDTGTHTRAPPAAAKTKRVMLACHCGSHGCCFCLIRIACCGN